mgnify:FL=1
MAASSQAQEIIDEFTFLDDWEERYQHLIDLGRRLPPLDEAHKVEENRLRGCQSVVHFRAEFDDPLLRFHAGSDAAIVQGLIALMLRVYSGQTPQDILATSPEFLKEIGLDEHLSPTRKNGLASLVSAIMGAAEEART